MPSCIDARAGGAGYMRNYEAYYDALDQSGSITVSLDEYATPEGAMAGFKAFAEDTIPSPNFAVLGVADLPGPAAGDEPKVFSLTTYHYRDDTISDYVDATFRLDNLIARITYERYLDPSSPDARAAQAGTPVAPNAPQTAQVAHVETMATRLADRIEAVRAGANPPGVAMDLAARVLPLERLPAVWNGQSWEGYEDAAALLGGGGAFGDRFAADFRHGYSRTVSLGTRAAPGPPYLAVTVSEWASPEATRALLAAIEASPSDPPPPEPASRGAQHAAVAGFALPEADAALAFTAALDESDPSASPDSARVVFAIGPRLVTVDVQGLADADAALTAASTLAAQQAACLLADQPCAAATLPPA